MPFLIGGRKYKKNIWPHGLRVKSIKRVGKLGDGTHSAVYEVKVTIEKNGYRKKMSLAEKEFKPSRGAPFSKTENDPVAQFNIMTELAGLNNEKNLA